MHRRTVVDDQDVALAPDVVIDDLRPDHPLEQITHVDPARLGGHPDDVRGLGDVEVHRARSVHRMGAHHRVLDRLAVPVLVFRARVGVPVQPVERRERLEAPALVLRQGEIGRAHVGHAGAAAGRGNLLPVQDGGGRRALAVGVVGVPLLGRLLAVPVPDQPDQGEVRHVVLRVVLLHRRPEHRGGGEILGGRQGLVVEHQRQMIGQRLRQRVPGRLVDRRAQVDAGHLGAQRRMDG